MSTYKINTDCRDVVLCVGFVGELQQDARFANTTVTNDQQLEQAVVLLKSHSEIFVELSRAGLADRATQRTPGCFLTQT